MPFDDLVHVIETLKERIGAHRQSLQSNETRTRMALIDPLLRALGWDTEDPALVLPEYELDTSRDTNRRADYALLGAESKPAAVIEAKKLGAPLANYLDQMLNYANRSGIRYAGVTDGNHWEIYTVFDPKPLEERRLLQVSVANDAPHECALKLLLLWRPNLASGQPIQPSTPVLADSAELQPPSSAPEPLPEHVAPAPSEDWIALTELGTTAGAQAPEAIRFPDGEEVSTRKSWRSVVEDTGLWLDRRGLIPPGSSIPSSSKGYMLHPSPAQPTGKKFAAPVHLPKSGTYLETHGSAHGVVNRAHKLLKAFGQDPARVYVRPRA